MSSHPLQLSTTANGTHGGGSSYNTGVTYELDGSTVTYQLLFLVLVLHPVEN